MSGPTKELKTRGSLHIAYLPGDSAGYSHNGSALTPRHAIPFAGRVENEETVHQTRVALPDRQVEPCSQGSKTDDRRSIFGQGAVPLGALERSFSVGFGMVVHINFLTRWSGRSMMEVHNPRWTPQVTFSSDASGSWKCGAVLKNECSMWVGKGTAAKELLPIVLLSQQSHFVVGSGHIVR